ncbi:MAG: 2-amino-4-hydroxy-6-hydroxymethyldihydropteridine diphosphokinase, partial [Terrimicrobiaceae bacterium]
ALGSNLADRLENLRAARRYLFDLHEDRGPFLCSRIYETEPVDCPAGSPSFFNAAIELACTIPPLDLLEKLQRLEQILGRPANHAHHAPRTIDLDILYYDNLAFTLPELTLPHPRIAERGFVLTPLADIAPDRILPGQLKKISELLKKTSVQSKSTPVADF